MASELVLYVYGYNHSSWSMRAGLALRQTGAPFREVAIRDDPAGFAALKQRSPSGLFPLLEHDSEWIWDSLAIAEYLAELHPQAGLWPRELAARAHARSMVAEMHSGFSALRTALPMDIRQHYPGFYKSALVRQDIARIASLWGACLERFGGAGPFLFGSFTLADAFFAPVVMRFTTYDVALTPPLTAYMQAVREQPSVKDWLARAALDSNINPSYAFER